MRSRYKITAAEGVYFITSTIIEWLPVFTNQKYFEIIIASLKFCREQKGLKLYAFVILDNHFHLVVAGPDLSNMIASLKKFTAWQVLFQLQEDRKDWLLNQLAYFKKKHKTESAHQVWQEGVHPQLIVNEEMLLQKIEYMHNNPIKRGLVDAAAHWHSSSARNFEANDHSIIALDPLPVG